MEGQIRNAGLPLPKTEYCFHPDRKYRFDFAWPEYMIALEVEGGTYTGGRHVTPSGFEKDCEKYNDAACLGWSVIRVTSNMIDDFRAINYMIRVLGRKNGTAYRPYTQTKKHVPISKNKKLQ